MGSKGYPDSFKVMKMKYMESPWGVIGVNKNLGENKE
jgi:hypothetical protein